MRCVAVSLLALLASTAAADPAKLTLPQVLDRALAGPKSRMADEDRAAAEARVDEADAARLPRLKLTAFGTISPEIRCVDAACTMTSPKTFALRFSGLFGSAQLDVTQPVYTFGKLAHARTAARAGLDAQVALADEAAGDLAVDAARAYWGVKLARELGYMLDDGIDQIGEASHKLDGNKDLSIQDKQRVAVLVAEAKVQRADARQAEIEALAGLRALTGIADADVDDATMEPVKRDVPAAQLPTTRRPQAIAAHAGAVAADELAAFEASHYWPDLALVGSAIYADAQGADVPPSAYANNPYNRVGAGLVLALQWTFEPWNVAAKTHRAQADARKAHALADLAQVGARYDMQTALAEVTGAHERLAAATEGEKAARTWLAAVLQGEAIGAAEAKDLADAYIAWFQMRARWSLAIFQWNVAVVRLDRAAGEFHAGPHRR